VKTLPQFVDTTVTEIDRRLRELKEEASRLKAALAALTGNGRTRRRLRANGGARGRSRSTSRRSRAGTPPRSPRGGNTRATQALELVRQQPGITIPEMAKAMKIQPNYLYRVLPRLASNGEIKREGQGWHPASSSTSTPTVATRSSRRSRASESPVTNSVRGRERALAGSATTSRAGRGTTTASVLSALSGGDPMTASEVAAKAGLARPTVSTTLSKLAKSGRVEKAERGYRLTRAV
jgi:DNA-binding IscR family transcriptional regulator